ncbi:B3/B4 domain-containing protein [Alteribacillus bidgolensis]|uniref:Phosphoenolpyruvate synthase n=1 Tax=Alteribacillus bidgolensis TaxID=930129 RepID=A0A1G8MYC5_9BACI|nr:phenylalanine--tRNA ligase beta subunit-related protein [Alteribacillus bidgolensis]SDI72825.1 phosphoenolpyruvate synthase [Alteribacillus bidgolensis]
MQLILSEDLLTMLPSCKLGIITYKNIVVDESPKMLKGRLEFFQEKIRTDLKQQSVLDYPGVREWHDTFKTAGIDPNRYRPSQEALFRRIEKGKTLPFIHSAADLNNFFSLQYEIPIGIYNFDTLSDYIKICIGKEGDSFEGLNGRKNNMNGKICTLDNDGVFGSPIVDSLRTKTDTNTINAVQIFYLKSSMNEREARELLQAASKMFTQLHSGEADTYILCKTEQEAKIT